MPLNTTAPVELPLPRASVEAPETSPLNANVDPLCAAKVSALAISTANGMVTDEAFVTHSPTPDPHGVESDGESVRPAAGLSFTKSYPPSITIESYVVAGAVPPPPLSVPESHVTVVLAGVEGKMSCAPAGGPPGAVHDAPDVVDQFEPTDQSLPLVPDPPIQVHTVDDD